MSHVWISLRFLTFMTVLTGLIYPISMTYLSMFMFHDRASGSLLTREGKLVGSSLIAQKFENPKYFRSRPSAVDFNPLPSSGSNLGPSSQALKDMVAQRQSEMMSAHLTDKLPPQDLLFASGSGLDPHISPAAAHYQLERIAKSRNINPAKVRELIDRHTEGAQYGLFGEARVNVLQLNLALDASEPTLK